VAVNESEVVPVDAAEREVAGQSVEPTSEKAEVTTERKIARLFGLKGESWMRHANPVSVWTRFSPVSLIALSIWSREWIGWYCLIPLGLTLIWLMVNPLLFKEPTSTRNWASKAVFGERIWSDRTAVDIPEQFRSRVPNLANAYSAIGMVSLAYGLVVLNVLAVVAGIVIVHGGKLWYLDRMVLLFEDMKGRSAEYAAWEY
jgi:hypothetical protein